MDSPLSLKVEKDGSISQVSGGPLEEPLQTGATVLRTFRVHCGATDHAFSYAGGALSGTDLIFCSKCGEVRRLAVTVEDD